MTPNPIICAIDTTDLAKASALAAELKGSVGALKLGLEFFSANGMAGVREMEASGLPIFLDLKFHDIPNTVAGAIKALSGLNIFMLTIHTSGGKAMMEAAVKAVDEAYQYKARPLLLGVTVLTSLDKEDLKSMNVDKAVWTHVETLALLAEKSGLDGVVCSANEVMLLDATRKNMSNRKSNFKLVVPGIRPEGADKGDQKRTMTPKEAISQGADYLVIGRPITGAPKPKEAAQAILNSL